MRKETIAASDVRNKRQAQVFAGRKILKAIKSGDESVIYMINTAHIPYIRYSYTCTYICHKRKVVQYCIGAPICIIIFLCNVQYMYFPKTTVHKKYEKKTLSWYMLFKTLNLNRVLPPNENQLLFDASSLSASMNKRLYIFC